MKAITQTEYSQSVALYGVVQTAMTYPIARVIRWKTTGHEYTWYFRSLEAMENHLRIFAPFIEPNCEVCGALPGDAHGQPDH